MNILNITVSTKADRIPQIINGSSANTMYYFINYEKLPKECYGNDSTPSIPYDLDDFSRCVLAANAFNYTQDDIQSGIENIKLLKAAPKFVFLFENFLKMKAEFEAGNNDAVKVFISNLRQIQEVQK